MSNNSFDAIKRHSENSNASQTNDFSSHVDLSTHLDTDKQKKLEELIN